MVKTVDMRTVYKICHKIEKTAALLMIPCVIGMIITITLTINETNSVRAVNFNAIPLFALCFLVGIPIGTAYVKKQLCAELKNNEVS